MIQTLLRPLALALLLSSPALADMPDPGNWDAVMTEARGQTVYWNAWGGSEAVNAYIDWVAATVEDRYGVTVEHVKLSDTAEAVSRVIAEKAAGRDSGGAVDLIWINGENFAAMKEQGLLFGPWADRLPNWRYVDSGLNPSVAMDFTIPTEGYEAPWGMAQIVFFHDAARLASPPRSIPALADWLQANPGRFAYPQPPDFLGTTFLKQALIALAPDPSVLQGPPEAADYDKATAPLWTWLDGLTPGLWRAGAAYPPNGARLVQLMADGEVDLAFSFNPNEVPNAIAAGQLPDTVRSYVLNEGSIANASFVAIPYNASAAAGAMVVADFLMSPEAQARMQDPSVWGQRTVLALERLDAADRALFAAIDHGQGGLAPGQTGRTLPEPHPGWMERIEKDWARRYGIAP